jgi:two-component system LytT family sensor kinase
VVNDTVRRRVTRTAIASLVLSVALGVLFTLRAPSVLAFAVATGVSLMYSLAIGLPATLIFGRLRPQLASTAFRQWAIYLGVLAAIVLVASLLVGLVLVAVGLVELDRLWDHYRYGLAVSLVVSIPVTVGAATMSRMQDALHRTESERQRALALAAEARLASLESRVRPHFLFNALNSAIALIPEDPRRAEDLLERMSGLLRASLDAQARLVTLEAELAVVTDYLEIERVRFADRLRYEIDVPADVRAVEIPAFSLQTLVENSVKYAVSSRQQGAKIRVSARRDDDRVVLEIVDDGPGFGNDVWVPGHGLAELRARLDAVYGDRARIVAPAEGAQGAAVRIEVPA